MPELPEVETIRRGIAKFVLNKKITQVSVLTQKSFFGEKTEVENTKIVQLRRRGKALIFDLSNGNSFLIHLRMTGQVIFVGSEVSGDEEILKQVQDDEELGSEKRFAGGHPNENFVSELPNKQTRVIFQLENGKMFFNDQRKFGFVKVMKTEDVEEDEFIRKLGKEPWEMETKELYEKLKGKSICIKGALLDQTIMAGLGNIYADETLYLAKVHPERKCNSLSEKEVEKLILSARKTMEDSLNAGGSTIKNYVKADGTKGDYLELFAKAYGRKGKKCERCGKEIQKIRVAGRGTYFCPECQKC